MQSIPSYYQVTPRILPVGKPATVHIRPLFDHVAIPEDAQLAIRLAERDTRRQHSPAIERRGPLVAVTFTPEREQEYVLLWTVTRNGETLREEKFSLYALENDLFGLRPWKGDFHIHSNASDGREAPAYVAGACRRIGLDFMALTDHRRYAPSLEAISAFASLDIDLRMYPGEEVHPPDNPVHHINFGGDRSINEMFADRTAYEQAVDRVEAKLADVPLTGPEKRIFASSVWVFEQIRAAGGVSVFCHPYWITGEGYNVSEALQQVFYARKPFDALELIGGYFRWQMESNALQAARWQEERAAGRAIPVVGVSDAHGCDRGELFGWYYSIVFAESPDFPDLRAAIRAGRCVAVEAVEGEFPRLYGSFRLVKLGYFLMREVFPRHDELCFEEGRLMLDWLAGNREAAGALARLRGRTAAHYDRLWGVG